MQIIIERVVRLKPYQIYMYVIFNLKYWFFIHVKYANALIKWKWIGSMCKSLNYEKRSAAILTFIILYYEFPSKILAARNKTHRNSYSYYTYIQRGTTGFFKMRWIFPHPVDRHRRRHRQRRHCLHLRVLLVK